MKNELVPLKTYGWREKNKCKRGEGGEGESHVLGTRIVKGGVKFTLDKKNKGLKRLRHKHTGKEIHRRMGKVE